MVYDELASFTPVQVAKRNGVSKAYVFAHIREGKLQATRLGGTGPLRITRDAEVLWINGQHSPADPPAFGVEPARAASLAARRMGK